MRAPPHTHHALHGTRHTLRKIVAEPLPHFVPDGGDPDCTRGRRAIAILAFLATLLLGYSYYNYVNGSTEDYKDEVSINLKKHKDLILKVDEEFQNKYTKIPRYLSFVRLDKPVYVAGDTVRARVVVLNEKTFMPYEPPKRGGKKDRRPFRPPLNCEMKIYGYVFFYFTNSQAHSSNYAHSRNARTTDPKTTRSRR